MNTAGSSYRECDCQDMSEGQVRVTVKKQASANPPGCFQIIGSQTNVPFQQTTVTCRQTGALFHTRLWHLVDKDIEMPTGSATVLSVLALRKMFESLSLVDQERQDGSSHSGM